MNNAAIRTLVVLVSLHLYACAQPDPGGVHERPDGSWAWTRPREAPAPLDDPEITFDVRPNKDRWEVGEQVVGKVFVRNRSARWKVIEPADLPYVEMVKETGEAARKFDSRSWSCGFGLPEPRPTYIEPGGTHEISFSLDTDPLGMSGGYIVEPGRYRVVPSCCPGQSTRAVVDSPTTEFVGPAPLGIGARIVAFGAGPGRISILRESGAAESYDVENGRLVAKARMDGFVAPKEPMAMTVFSPDARWLAVVNSGQTTTVRILRLDDSLPGDSDRRLQFQEKRYLAGYDRSSRILRLATIKESTLIDLATGVVTVEPRPISDFHLSPDRDYMVCLEPRLRAAPTVGGPVLDITTPECVAGYLESHAGHRGFFFGCSNGRSVVFERYDGGARSTFQTKCIVPIDDSPDGRYVALGTVSRYMMGHYPKPGRLEVWEVEPPRRLLSIDDGRARVPEFTGDDGLLVCVVAGPRRDNRLTWYENTVEVWNVRTGAIVRELRLATDSFPP